MRMMDQLLWTFREQFAHFDNTFVKGKRVK
jgi:hypothetical protein